MGRFTVEFKFGLGDDVYIKSDIDQTPRMIIQMSVSPGNCVQYQLASGDRSSWHYEMELALEKNVVKTSTH